jgi:MarR family transcriptional regulator, organic hydroperoxide resistance regulator
VRADVAPPREGGNLVAKIHQLSGRVFARILRAHGVHELNPAQGRIIYELWKEDGISQAQLAARTRLDKSTLTLMLNRLEKQGQLRRSQDRRDARRRIVELTPRNRGMHAAYTAASREMVSIFYNGLPDREIERFESTLRAILTNLETPG